MLSWSVRQLAEVSGISESSIRRVEAAFGIPDNVTLDLLVKMQEFFEGRGFTFEWRDQNGPGVFWQRNERRGGPSGRGDAGLIVGGIIGGYAEPKR
jgi:hypothetical protein